MSKLKLNYTQVIKIDIALFFPIAASSSCITVMSSSSLYKQQVFSFIIVLFPSHLFHHTSPLLHITYNSHHAHYVYLSTLEPQAGFTLFSLTMNYARLPLIFFFYTLLFFPSILSKQHILFLFIAVHCDSFESFVGY